MQLFQTLEEQLKKEPNYFSDSGELKKWVVVDKARNFDAELLELLLKNEELKQKFFVDVKGTLVFNQNLFVRFLEQKNYLNDSYTEYKNKIGLTIDGKYLKQRNEVALAWAYKDCVLEGGQSREEDKREEIFFNEILAQDEITQLLEPKILTGAKRCNADGEQAFDRFNRSEEGTITDNLIIKGNNLLALHSLKKEFAGKVKLIYIDPPYNTDNDDFAYNDSFSHSTWLTFMKNRLEVANNLLKDDGGIFIQCDDIEVAHLKILCDEIFLRENFINLISYERSGSAGIGQGGRFVDTTEYILIYEKKKNQLKFNEILKSNILDYEVMKRYNKKLLDVGQKQLVDEFVSKSNGEPVRIYKHYDYQIETISLRKFEERELEIRKEFKDAFDCVFRTTNPQIENSFQQELLSKMDGGLFSVEYIPSRGKYKNESKTIFYNNNEIFAWLKDTANIEGSQIVKLDKISTMWSHSEIPKADLANEGGVILKRGKKPEQLLRRIIKMATEKNDIVLDFYSGSGTTCAVAHKMNRQYIGVEQLNYSGNDSVTRLRNVINGDQTGISKTVNWKGGGKFVYLELKKYNQIFIEKIEAAQDTGELLEIWEEMKQKSFLNYNVDIKRQDEEIESFKGLSLDEQKRHLVEILDKNQLYVNLSSMNDRDFEVTEDEKRVTRDFYNLEK